MMKKQYILELRTEKPYVKIGQKNDPDVKKVQEWINLWKRYDPKWKISTAIDGEFGPGTLATVKEFQRFHKLEDDGIVGNYTWRKLTEPMTEAFTKIKKDLSLNELIVAYAEQHLKSSPREFRQNEGTWVRAYMDGNEGSQWAWCLGFVQTIVDQAAFTNGNQAVTDYMPFSYGCDDIGNHGLKTGKLIRNADLKRGDIKRVKPGDVFLNVKTERDWTHTGIITEIKGEWIETIEGNTNDEGSREGYEVCARKRNFTTKNIDIYRILP